jgi:hypothetical protein
MIAMSTSGAAAPPASPTEALEMLTSALGYLAAADATQLPAEVQARCLAGLERSDAVGTAARASLLAAFAAGQGPAQDGDYGPRSWLVHRTRVTRGTAAAHLAWVRRRREHPRILAALAAGEITASYARALCGWTDKLPGECRDAADAILVAAASRGMDLRDLAGLAAEIQSRAAPADGDPGPGFEDRAVRLETTFQGAGVLSGDLSPECAAFVTAVLDALSAPQGAEDSRSHAQRYHDALEEAMRRLVTAGLLPERAGQPVKVLAHISLADLMVLDADSALQQEWVDGVRARWAGYRAAASGGGGDGGAWLDGPAADGVACDGSVTPVVLGDVNPAVLEDLVRLCVQLARYHHHAPSPGPAPAATAGPVGPSNSAGPSDPAGPAAPSGPAGAGDVAAPVGAPGDPSGRSGSVPGTGPALEAGPLGLEELDPGTPRVLRHLLDHPEQLTAEALERLVIGRAAALVAGPDGLASFLRRAQLGAGLGGPSLPLDVGYSDAIPAAIRTAVRARDRFCQWAGGCRQPAAACEVHHLRHRRHGGVTSVENCILVCHFHHHVMIHRMGWTLVRYPDGTTMAWNRDKSKILRSHSPPARAG